MLDQVTVNDVIVATMAVAGGNTCFPQHQGEARNRENRKEGRSGGKGSCGVEKGDFGD